MLSNLSPNTNNIVPPYSPRLRSPSPYANRSLTPFEDKEKTVMGKRFPEVGKPKPRKKKRNLTVIHQTEPRSHSVDRVGRGNNSEDIKRNRSVQSLTESEDGTPARGQGYKIARGLKAIRFLPKNILLKKIPTKLWNKFNSDSSTVEGDDSEVDSSSDWSQRETLHEEKKSKYYHHRAQSDSVWYGLDRVVEDKETTATPPSTRNHKTREDDRDDEVRYIYEDGHIEYNQSSEDSSLSDSSSSEDTSFDSSNQPTPTIHNTRRKSLSKVLAGKYHKRKSPKKQKINEEYSPRKSNKPKPKKETKSAVNVPDPPSQTKPDTLNINSLDNQHEVACPQINIICSDHEEKACSLSAPHSSGSLMSPIHKSKSATALIDYPSHECESALSSVLIAPDYKEHGPCLLPSSRIDAEVDRIHASGTPGSSSHTANYPIAVSGKVSQSPAKVNSVPCIHRRSSDSDLSITPKGNSLTGSDRSSGVKEGHSRQIIKPSMNQESLDMLEYPFLTMAKYPAGFIQHLGGTVSARSVKLLERITNLEEPETRDAWWTELRMEVRSHARAMGCNVVIGYSENTSICDDVCVLSASGTAALINLNATSSENDVFTPQHPVTRTTQIQHQGKEMMTASLDRCDFEKDAKANKMGDATLPPVTNAKSRQPADVSQDDFSSCSVCHIPYSESSVPFRVNMQKCAICRRGKVPDVLFTTIDLIDNVHVGGKGCFIHSYVCRAKRDCKGEMNAKEISDGLPFLEYELHRLLINKLKVRGMNAIFGLKVQVSIGEKMLVGLATGTAVFLTALPTPPIPKISAGNAWKDNKKLSEMQKQLQDALKKNRDLYQLKSATELESHVNGRPVSEDTDDSDDDLPDLDLSLGNKDTCILEVDDAEDADIVSLLIDPPPPDGFHVVNTEFVPNLDELEVVKNLQMFTQIWRAKIPLGQPLTSFNQHFNRLLQSVYFKLRNMVPCALSDLQFKIILEQDEIQLSLLGMALGLGDLDLKKKKLKSKLMPSLSRETVKKLDDSDLIFSLEEDSTVQNKTRSKSPVRMANKIHKHTPPRSRYGVDITPLSYVPGGKIERYLGNLNFFFIRESTCIREGGGLSGFVHSFITEVLAIVRAHVTALGGNAMVAYFMSECFLYHYPHKNQGQCLINVGGDVVYISYYSEDQQ